MASLQVQQSCLSSRRGVPLALKLAALPPLTMDSPINEKDQLPCIMITPSSPTHEYDYEVLYFRPEPPCQGFLSNLRRTFWPRPSDAYAAPPPHLAIALPESPRVSQYGDEDRRNDSWSAGKRFRWILMLFACLFFTIHLFALPKVVEGGLYDVFSTHHGWNMVDDAVAPWEHLQPADAIGAGSNPQASPTYKAIKGDALPPTPNNPNEKAAAEPTAAAWDDFVTASMI